MASLPSSLRSQLGDPDRVAQVWDRLPDETAQQFHYFSIFRDLGPSRTLADTARSGLVRVGLLSILAREHHWRGRAEAWDAHLDEIRQRRQIDEAARMDERHASLALKIQEKAIQRLDGMSDEEVRHISHGDLLKWVMESCKLETQARRPAADARMPAGKGKGSRVVINNSNVAAAQANADSQAGAVAVVAPTPIIETVVRTREEVDFARQNPRGELVDGD